MRMRVLFAALLVWSATVAATSWRAAPDAQGPAPKPVAFGHQNHVSERWLSPGSGDSANPETYRDCRGCHRFGPNDLHSSPQRVCAACHVGTGTLQPRFEPGWNNDLSAYKTRTDPAFRHHTHGMLECRECHLPPSARFRGGHFPIHTGPGQCARCHDPQVNGAVVATLRWFQGLDAPGMKEQLGLRDFERPADTDAARAEYAVKLNRVFAGPTGGVNTPPTQLPVGGKFDHADHIDPTGGPGGIECGVCHATIPTAQAAQVGTGQIQIAGCKDCHIKDAAKQPAGRAPAAQNVDRPLWTLGTFAHVDHYRFLGAGAKRDDTVAGEPAHRDIAERGCKACHAYAPSVPGFSDRDFPFEPNGRYRYRDCIACHDVAGWQTGETETAPLHHSTGGAGNGWQRCGDCHVLGEPDLKKTRPQLEVQRWTARTFRFPANTHPDITTTGVQRAGAARAAIDCSECHRAKVPALDSRVRRQQFRHDTHLPAQWDGAACAKCHPRANTATNAAELAVEPFRTYTLAVCTDCHWGGPVSEETADDEQPAVRRVVAFPHGPHVQQHRQGCQQCHALGEDGRDVTTKPTALDCSACHDHVDNGPDDSNYEGLFDGRAASCGKCHRGEVAGARVATAPVPNAVRTSAQSQFAGFADAQYHPDQQACTACHRRIEAPAGDPAGRWRTIAVPVATDHLRAVHPGKVHTGAPFPDVPACLRCHWTAVDGMADGARNAAGTPAQRESRGAPESPKTRREFGNAFDDYPGGERARG